MPEHNEMTRDTPHNANAANEGPNSVSFNYQAGNPLGSRAGNPPTSKSDVTRSSISREHDDAATPKHGTIVDPKEQFRAAQHQHYHAGGLVPSEVDAAQKGLSDLVGRTWRKDITPNRDEKRLMARYEATVDAHNEEVLRSYRNCTRCQGTTPDSETDTNGN